MEYMNKTEDWATFIKHVIVVILCESTKTQCCRNYLVENIVILDYGIQSLFFSVFLRRFQHIEIFIVYGVLSVTIPLLFHGH